MKMFRKDEGFTLVELMVVVLIIGILVAIAIPVFNSAKASAQKGACQANLRTLDGAVQQWVAADSTTNDEATLTTLALAKAAIQGYVKDFDASAQCPTDASAYTMGTLNGHTVFACPNVALGHTY